jgi:hypothetical protein
VVSRIRDPDVRRELTENAHRDLIASGEWSYRRLIDDVDETLGQAGLRSRPDAATETIVAATLSARLGRRRRRRLAEWAMFAFLGWGPMQWMIKRAKPVTSRVRRALGIPSQDAVA